MYRIHVIIEGKAFGEPNGGAYIYFIKLIIKISQK